MRVCKKTFWNVPTRTEQSFNGIVKREERKSERNSPITERIVDFDTVAFVRVKAFLNGVECIVCISKTVRGGYDVAAAQLFDLERCFVTAIFEYEKRMDGWMGE